jgi:hypothetical protein
MTSVVPPRTIKRSGLQSLREPFLLGEEIIEGFYCGEFVFLDVEHGIQLGHVKDVVNFLAEAQELEVAARIPHRGEATDQFAHAGGIDVIDVRQVENNFFLALCNQPVDRVPQLSGFIAQSNPPGDVDNGYVADFARGDGHVRIRSCVVNISVSALAGMLERWARQVNGPLMPVAGQFEEHYIFCHSEPAFFAGEEPDVGLGKADSLRDKTATE